MAEKPGFKTTEWWLSLLIVILGGLMASGLFSEGSWALQAIGGAMSLLGGANYSHGRARLKQAAELSKPLSAADPP